jgi:predicted metal-dependent hydrolase
LKEKTGGPVIFTDLSEFSTRRHILKIERTEDKMTSYIVTNDSITVSLPFTEDILSRTNQEKIKNGIISALRIEAKSILPDRLNELAQMHGFKYSAMQVKNMKSRWGSCTGRNKINLNLHLIRLPDSLIDYVLLHELAHTVHKNHSDEFWNYLGKFCEEPKKRARELKSYKTEI